MSDDERSTNRLDEFDDLWYRSSTTGVGSWIPEHMEDEVITPGEVTDWTKDVTSAKHPRSGPRTLVIYRGLMTHRSGIGVRAMRHLGRYLSLPGRQTQGAQYQYWTATGWAKNQRQLQWMLDTAKNSHGDSSLLEAAYDLEREIARAESAPVLFIDRLDAVGLWGGERDRLLDLVMARSSDPYLVTILTLEELEPHLIGDGSGHTSVNHTDWNGFLTDPASCVWAELVI